VSIECTKEGVKFVCNGDIGSGSVQLRQHSDVEKPEKNVDINLTEPVALTFSLKYLVNFCKASGLSDQVKLSLSNEVPLLVEYALSNNSYLRFYLAPKVRSRPRRFSLFSLLTCSRLATRSKQVNPTRSRGACIRKGVKAPESSRAGGRAVYERRMELPERNGWLPDSAP
jgi:hypothetical protein